VLFAYVDESSNRLHYRAVALVVSPANIRALAVELDAVITRASASFAGVGRDFELHGHDLFGATEA
jgi:hypothetical protein